MLNNVTIMGRLTADPELRRTQSGTAVCSFTLAVQRDYQSRDGGEKEADFINCVAWRNEAEFIAKYFQKGRMMALAGKLQTRRYQDKDGVTRHVTEIVAESVYFSDTADSGKRPGYNAPSAPRPAAAAVGGADEYEEIEDDGETGDLPF